MVEKITGHPVRFKFLDGAGLQALVVDGSKPQAVACGQDLLSRNVPEKTGIQTTVSWKAQLGPIFR